MNVKMKKGHVVTSVCLLLAAAAGLFAPVMLKSRQDRNLGKMTDAEGVEAVSLSYARETVLTEKLDTIGHIEDEISRLNMDEGIFLKSDDAIKIADEFLKALTGKSHISYYRSAVSTEMRYFLNFGSLVLWCVDIETDAAMGKIWLDDVTGCILAFDLHSGESGTELPQLLIEKAGEDRHESIETGIIESLASHWKERLSGESIAVTQEGQLYSGGKKVNAEGNVYSNASYWGDFKIMVSEGASEPCACPVVVLEDAIAFNNGGYNP